MIDPVLGYDTEKYLDVFVGGNLSYRLTRPISDNELRTSIREAYKAGLVDQQMSDYHLIQDLDLGGYGKANAHYIWENNNECTIQSRKH